jgi:hypothetical protein
MSARLKHFGWGREGEGLTAEEAAVMSQRPGADDCARLSFHVNGDPDFTDLSHLFTDCVWDAGARRWERKQ